jgi:hypothetical protein
MMPSIREKVTPVTSSQLPQTSTAALVGSVRGRRPRTTATAMAAMIAAGSSQAICPPISEPNNFVADDWSVQPTLPVSSPVNRPRPL